MLVIVGSMNPVKLQAAKALQQYGGFEFSSAEVDSGVSDQPSDEEESMEGAVNRAKGALAKGADLGVGFEGGVRDDGETMWCYAACAITDGERTGTSMSAEFPLPSDVRKRVLAGEELGPVIDDVFGTENQKHKEGAVGMLTKNSVTRSQLYEQAILFAYIPWLHPEKYR